MAALRVFFFLLLLANVVFVAMRQGYIGGKDEGREPQRLAAQINPDKIKLVVPSTATVPVAPTMACRLLEGLLASDAERLRRPVEDAGLSIVARPADEPASRYWVHIPGLAGKAGAEKKAGELRALGINDFHVMPTGNDTFAISLGVFRAEPDASALLAALVRKGVRSARIEQRNPPAERVTLEIRGPADVLNRRLPELAAATVGIETKSCP